MSFCFVFSMNLFIADKYDDWLSMPSFSPAPYGYVILRSAWNETTRQPNAQAQLLIIGDPTSTEYREALCKQNSKQLTIVIICSRGFSIVQYHLFYTPLCHKTKNHVILPYCLTFENVSSWANNKKLNSTEKSRDALYRLKPFHLYK